MQITCNKVKKSNITKIEIYQTLNEIILADSIQLDTLCDAFEKFDFYNNAFINEFSNSDKQFAIEQYNLLKSLELDSKKLNYRNKTTNTLKNIAIKTNCGDGLVYNLTLPIISADRKKVLIKITSHSNCMFGSNGGLFLFEKRNNKWVKTKSFDTWISLESKKDNHC